MVTNNDNFVSRNNMQERAKPNLNIISPTVMLPSGIEMTVVSIPRVFKREMQTLFRDRVSDPGLVAIMTSQRSRVDLVNWGGSVEVEKDALLERFMKWAEALHIILNDKGYWSDYVDPCSGIPVKERGCATVYPETDAFESLLKYRSTSASGCKVISHPKWGTFFYPASFFTNAPIDVIRESIEIVEKENHFSELPDISHVPCGTGRLCCT